MVILETSWEPSLGSYGNMVGGEHQNPPKKLNPHRITREKKIKKIGLFHSIFFTLFSRALFLGTPNSVSIIPYMKELWVHITLVVGTQKLAACEAFKSVSSVHSWWWGEYKGPAGEYEQIWQLQPKKHFLWIHGAFCFIFKIYFNLKKNHSYHSQWWLLFSYPTVKTTMGLFCMHQNNHPPQKRAHITPCNAPYN